MKLRISTRIRMLMPQLLALLLVAGFLSQVAAIASVSAGNTCALACCAGRAPHAAGSCMDGSCHAAIRLRKKVVRRALNSFAGDKFCGITRVTTRKLLSYSPPQAKQNNPAETELSPSVLKQPCRSDCGGCVSGSVSSKDKATPIAAERPQPLTFDYSYEATSVQSCDNFCHQFSPRGPPNRLHA